MNFADRIGANRVVVALSIARLGDAIGNSILIIVLPLYVSKLSAPWFPVPDTVRVGILISFYGLAAALLQPVMGALTDRLARRKPLIQGGLFVMALSTLGFVIAHRFTDLLVLRVFQGIGVALTIPASLALMATSTQKNTRGGSMGIYSTMRMVGFAIGPLLGGLLHDHAGFNASFVVGSAFVLLGMLAIQMWVHEIPADPTGEPRHFQIVDRSLLSVGIIGLGFATFVMAAAFSMMATLETEFNARLNQSALGFSIAFSALMISRLLFQIPLGRLSDTIGRKPLIVAGLVLMAPATALLGLVGTTLQLTGVRLVQGLASAGIAAPAFAEAADLAKTGGEGRQMSIITMGFGLGIALGPLVAGVLSVVSFELPFFLAALLSLVGAWVVIRYVPETIHRISVSHPHPLSQSK
jgi:MFS family permease